MVKSYWRNLALAVFVLPSVLAVTKAQDLAVRNLNLSTTSRTEDYIIQNQRQYAAVILDMEAQLADFETSFKQQLKTITEQTVMIESKMLEVDQKLNPLELLDDLSKHCVQKYRGKISTVASVKSSLQSCVTAAVNNLASYVSPPKTYMQTLDGYYRNNVKAQLANCEKQHAASQFNYTVCVTQVISGANSYTITYQKNFATGMQTAKCSADGRIKTALDCGFTIFYSTISTIGATTRLIDNCIAGLEFCPPCPSASTGFTCSRALDLTFMASDFRNATIANPFYGLNNTLSCVQVNFIY